MKRKVLVTFLPMEIELQLSDEEVLDEEMLEEMVDDYIKYHQGPAQFDKLVVLEK